MKNQQLLLFVCLSFLSITAYAANPVVTDENIATTRLEVEDYNEIRINGFMDFSYEQTDEPAAVEVTLDAEFHSKLKVEVKNRILTIELKGVKEEQVTEFAVKTNSKWLKAMRIGGNASAVINTPLTGDELDIRVGGNTLLQIKKTVTATDLKLKISGSGNIVADDLQADKLECNLEGSGSITIKNGKAKAGEYSVAGSSDLRAYGMEVGELSCKTTGSAVVEVFATNSLNASVVGKGEISYKGEPGIQQKIYGSGKISPVGR